MSDGDGDLITLSPYVSTEANVLDSFNRLHKLSQAQFYKSNTIWKKLYQFIRIGIFGQVNEFEKYVLENEPNDCALVAKYYEITKLDLSGVDSLSVDELYLNTLHIPHPLIKFMKHENNQTIDISQDLKESPILVFIHGLGGQMSQFEPLMGLLSQCSEIVALDLPGFGNSKLNFNIKNYSFATLSSITPEEQQKISQSISNMADDDFKTENIVNIIIQFLSQKIHPNKKIVLVGHSMGCNLSIRVAKRLPPSKVEGLILLASPALVDDINFGTPNPNGGSKRKPKLPVFSRILSKFPGFIDLFRVWDRLEGLNSKSVLRQIGDTSINPFNTTLYIKLRQLRWNLDIETSILLKYVKGFQSCAYSDLISAIKKFNDNPFDKRIYEKTILVGATKDSVIPFEAMVKIDEMLSHSFQRKVSTLIPVKKAGHSLLLCKPEFISGKILAHIENNFPERLHLSPAWVLRVKADISGDKWGLKNELKWSQIAPISLNISRRINGEIDSSPLLGMKTLREGDQNHSPMLLENAFYGDEPQSAKYELPEGNLIAVVDISADIPPYNPDSFNVIKYYKCSTVSKVVPDPGSIRKFISLIDSILKSNHTENPLIAIHCHYGFNRTGFLICCYLIEKLGWTVEQAIEGFKVAKTPGIKHRHFIDALYVRYES